MTISPRAPTIPLDEERLITDDLKPGPGEQNSAETSRISREEMERLLQRQAGQDVWDNTIVPRLSDADLLGSKGGPGTVSLRTPRGEQDDLLDAVVNASTGRSWRRWQAAAVGLLCIALVAGLFAIRAARNVQSVDSNIGSPISISDQRELFDEQMAAAELLIKDKDHDGAVALLRNALRFVPADGQDQLKLGDAFVEANSPADALVVYRMATKASGDNLRAWNALADVQAKQRLYGEAAESYRQAISIADAKARGQGTTDNLWLAYAEALRLSGHTEAARVANQHASTSNSEVVSRPAKRRLSVLPTTTAYGARDASREAAKSETPERRSVAERPLVASAPPLPPPVAPAAPKAKLAEHDPDALFIEGVKIVSGRDPKKLQRAELVRALELFQYAARGGTHRTEASRDAERLGKEFDRRKKW